MPLVGKSPRSPLWFDQETEIQIFETLRRSREVAQLAYCSAGRIKSSIYLKVLLSIALSLSLSLSLEHCQEKHISNPPKDICSFKGFFTFACASLLSAWSGLVAECHDTRMSR